MNLISSLTAYPPSIGGAQLHHHQLFLHLARRHHVQVVTHWDRVRTDWLLGTTLRAPEQDSDYVQDGIPVHLIGLPRKVKLAIAPSVVTYYFAMDRAVEKIGQVLVERLKPFASDADLIHNVRIGRAGLSKASLLLAHKQEIPFFITPVHHPRWSGWRYRVYEDIFRHADGVIALTTAEKDFLIDIGVRSERIFITGIGPLISEKPNLGGFIRKHNIDGPMVLFLGQHYRHKGYFDLLIATKDVWKKFPEVHFVFIGPQVRGSEKHFKHQSDPRILQLGIVGLQEKTDAIAACTMLCVPSTQESFGGVYTEAWSLGKPVIGCNIPAVSEVISPNKDGLLVKQEPGDIANAICQLLASPSSANAMGEAGRKKVDERYSWEHLAALTEQAYIKVSGNTPSSPAPDRTA